MRENLLVSMAIAFTVAVSLLSVNVLFSDTSSEPGARLESPAAKARDNGVTTNSAFAPKSNRSFGVSGNGARR